MAVGLLNIDLNAVIANWRALDALCAESVETAVVIKADAYGLAASRVGPTLAKSGAKTFFVAAAEEGAELRRVLGPEPEIYVFSGHMQGDTDRLRAFALTPLLNSVEQLTRHFENLAGHRFGIQLDTGMNRLGMEPAEWTAVRDLAMQAGPNLIMSHLACSDDPDDPMNAAQLACFRDLTDGLDVRRSLAATGGTLLGPDYHFDMIRPGVGLYGGRPFADAKPVVHLSLPVIQTRTVETGEIVGYGNGYRASQKRRVATLAAGYADGLIRAMGGKVSVFAGETACPVIGRVSMDMLTVDVSHLADTPDSLDLLGYNQGVDVLADAAGTIGYEILTSLGARYERKYFGGDA